MQRILRLGLTSCFFAFALGGPAYADFVGAIASGTGTAAGGNGDLTSSSFSGTTQNNDFTGSGASNPNQVSLSLDVFAMGQPFVINFTTSNGLVTTGPGAEYFFTVSVTNKLGDNGVDPGDHGKEMGALDIHILGAAAGSGLATIPALFDSPANPFPTSSPSYAVNQNSPTFLRFGGNAGGGGAIPYHTTGTFTFSIDIPQTTNFAGGFTLQFTANPEPGSLALCSLLCAPALSLLRRRRKPAATDLAEPAMI